MKFCTQFQVLHFQYEKQTLRKLKCIAFSKCLQHGALQNIPHEVILWTNHRVMEWLRTIDLSEYAPNLRGSGVHGALMVIKIKQICGHHSKRKKFLLHELYIDDLLNIVNVSVGFGAEVWC